MIPPIHNDDAMRELHNAMVPSLVDRICNILKVDGSELADIVLALASTVAGVVHTTVKPENWEEFLEVVHKETVTRLHEIDAGPNRGTA